MTRILIFLKCKSQYDLSFALLASLSLYSNQKPLYSHLLPILFFACCPSSMKYFIISVFLQRYHPSLVDHFFAFFFVPRAFFWPGSPIFLMWPNRIRLLWSLISKIDLTFQITFIEDKCWGWNKQPWVPYRKSISKLAILWTLLISHNSYWTVLPNRKECNIIFRLKLWCLVDLLEFFFFLLKWTTQMAFIKLMKKITSPQKILFIIFATTNQIWLHVFVYIICFINIKK